VDEQQRGHRVTTAARLLMLVLAAVTGWVAVAAAGGTGHATDVTFAGPPSLAATAPSLLLDDTGVDGVSDSRRSRDASSSRSQDRVDPRFPDCDDARESGFGPYRQGRDVEYDWYTDADDDGVTCEGS
jgi:hypothetical protein